MGTIASLKSSEDALKCSNEVSSNKITMYADRIKMLENNEKELEANSKHQEEKYETLLAEKIEQECKINEQSDQIQNHVITNLDLRNQIDLLQKKLVESILAKDEEIKSLMKSDAELMNSLASLQVKYDDKKEQNKLCVKNIYNMQNELNEKNQIIKSLNTNELALQSELNTVNSTFKDRIDELSRIIFYLESEVDQCNNNFSVLEASESRLKKTIASDTNIFKDMVKSESLSKLKLHLKIEELTLINTTLCLNQGSVLKEKSLLQRNFNENLLLITKLRNDIHSLRYTNLNTVKEFNVVSDNVTLLESQLMEKNELILSLEKSESALQNEI